MYIKCCKNKVVIMLMTGVCCLVFSGLITKNVKVLSSSNENVTISAFLQNENIIIETIPNSKANNGNTMNKTQIWGDYGQGWFLIKDYGNNKENGSGKDKNQKFQWNLRQLDEYNESFYWNNASNSYQYDKQETDMFKIYVVYKKDFSQGHKKNNYEELYKTFYLGGAKQEVQLTTDHEMTEFVPISYDFPVVVTQGSKVELYLNAPFKRNTYKVIITGDNYTDTVVEKVVSNTSGEQKVYDWVPKECGTFNIAVYDVNSGVIVLKRKVHVNSDNNQYLQLGDLEISNIDNVVYVRLQVEDTRPNGDMGPIENNLKFTVFEPHVWSKTIKSYGDTVTFNSDLNRYEINELYDDFPMGLGLYHIGAYIKAKHSLEPDDVIVKSFRKSERDKTPFKLTCNSVVGKKNSDGSYQYKKNELMIFHFVAEGPESGYEYAFFLHDARGKRLIQDYSFARDFFWRPVDPGNYTISARMRNANHQSGQLRNAYEAEEAETIKISKPNSKIKITNVKIGNNEWKVSEGKPALTSYGAPLQSHTQYAIQITAENNGNNEKGALMYKTYVISKGYYYPTSQYTFSNVIPIYTKNPGEYRIIVMVKDSISGAEEDRCEILLECQAP